MIFETDSNRFKRTQKDSGTQVNNNTDIRIKNKKVCSVVDGNVFINHDTSFDLCK